jgi:hypothetical protein
MGMYSFFREEDIKITDWEGLLNFFKLWDEYIIKKGLEDYFSSGKMLDKENKKLSFYSWNDLKLISYWYNEEVAFLHLVSEFIEGYVEWDFENNDECGEIAFEEGKCKITTGVMSYSTSDAEDGINKEVLNKDMDLKKMLMLKNLK